MTELIDAPDPTSPAPTSQAAGTTGAAPTSDGAPTRGPVPFASLRLAVLVGALVLLGFVNPWMLVVVLALVLMITLHELGHFLTAKRAGMKVTEFFLGFGPRIWSTHRGETEYGIKLLPAGAYVKIIGMHNLEEVPPADEARTYRQKGFGERLSVAVAGSTMHFLLALGLIYVALVAVGQPSGTLNPDVQARGWQVGSVVPGSGADDAGLREGDKILSIDGEPVTVFNDLRPLVQPLEGETVLVVYERGGSRRQVDVDLRSFTSRGQERCCLGIGEAPYESERVNPIVGLYRTPVEFADVTVKSVQALGRFFTPGGISDFVGQVSDAGNDTTGAERSSSTTTPPPATGSSSTTTDDEAGTNRLLSIYGLVQIGSDVGQVNPGGLITLFALINIFIGVFNLVPMLPFDGGHVAIAVYEKVQEKRLRRTRYFADVGRLLPFAYAVVLVMGMLFVSTLYLDIANPLVTG